MIESSTNIAWEAARVAAAFGVGVCVISDHTDFWSLGNWLNDTDNGADHFEVQIDKMTGNMERLSVGGYECCVVRRYDMGNPGSAFVVWTSHLNPYNELMARGLYRLGFEDPAILAQLPPLSAHEKLELRLSMPREFWPKTWLEEETDTNGT